MARPRKYNTAEEMQQDIEEYFENTPEEEWTITGLALALDMTRQSLLSYEGEVEEREKGDEFVDTIKKAKKKVENSYEKDLKKYGRSGTIFALKNFGWQDQRQHDVTSKGEQVAGFNYVVPEDGEDD